MSEYRQKLVITQNIGIALKIAETFPDGQRFKTQEEIVKQLADQVNWYLVGSGADTASKGPARKRKLTMTQAVTPLNSGTGGRP
jgi:hypothetical protein